MCRVASSGLLAFSHTPNLVFAVQQEAGHGGLVGAHATRCDASLCAAAGFEGCL